MRFTHVRAKLESNEENHHEETPKIRMKNYRGATSKSFGDVNKSPFGRNNVPYSSGEGYYKKGGHIHYFSSDWEIDAANTYFNNLVEDGLFNDEFLALTMEMLFYNENRQAGVHLSFQFLVDNAGDIDPSYIDAAMYNESLYKGHYRQYSDFLIVLLKIMDFIYLGGTVWVIIKYLMTIYHRINEIFKTKHFFIPWYDYIDTAVIALSITTICYWIIIFLAWNEVDLPISGNSEFQTLVDHCYKFTQLRSIASFQIVLMAFRSIRILTTQFPAFGCLFDTVKSSAFDLFTFMLTMFIICLGFIISA